ncbi:MAG TPA: arsenate reductase ArsC [Candidatus Binatia bacterium]|jgi:protein-tyrosine-phosphatase
MAEQQRQRILFLCTGNSARSIFAEYLIRKICPDRFEAYSAGSNPSGKVNPFTIEVLRNQYKIEPHAARSKSWGEFKNLRFDIIITVCDQAKESCPVFPGEPRVAHWSIPDPAAAGGTDDQKLRAFREAAQQIQRRIELLCSFPTEKLGHLLTESAKGAKSQNDFQDEI